MRKLVLQMQISVDSFIAGIDGSMDWATFDFDEKLRRKHLTLLEGADCILMAMGRSSVMQFIPYWANVATKPSDPFFEYATRVTEIPKIVLSKSLTKSDWVNTEVINGDFVAETQKLKGRSGGRIVTFGGAKLASALIKNNLVDEFHLLMNPVVLGNGLPIFRELESRQALALKDAVPYSCGIVWLHYGIKT